MHCRVLCGVKLCVPQELQKFCCYVVSSFFKLTAKNPLSFGEILSWKSASSCYEMTEGYGVMERERYSSW